MLTPFKDNVVSLDEARKARMSKTPVFLVVFGMISVVVALALLSSLSSQLHGVNLVLTEQAKQIEELKTAVQELAPKLFYVYSNLPPGHYKVTEVVSEYDSAALVQGPGTGAEEKLVKRIPRGFLKAGQQFSIGEFRP
jgi:hypothetical protein